MDVILDSLDKATKDKLANAVHNVLETSSLTQMAETERRRNHCTEMINCIAYEKYPHLYSFWFGDVLAALQKTEDELFVTVSKIMDIYNDPEIKGRKWWEQDYGWKKDILVDAIQSTPVTTTDDLRVRFSLPPIMHINEAFPGEI